MSALAVLHISAKHVTTMMLRRFGRLSLIQSLTHCWRCLHFDFIARTVGPRKHRVCQIVAGDRFGFCVPVDFASQSTCDSCQVAKVEHCHVRVNIRNWLDAIFVAVQKIQPMRSAASAFHRQIFVDLLDRIFGQRVFFKVFSRFPVELFTVNKNPSFVTFDQATIVA